MGSGSSKMATCPPPTSVQYRGRILDSHPANNRGVSYIKNRAAVVQSVRPDHNLPKVKSVPTHHPRFPSLPTTRKCNWERRYPAAHEAIVIAASMFAWRLCEWPQYQREVRKAIDKYCHKSSKASPFSLEWDDIFALKTNVATHLQMKEARNMCDIVGWQRRKNYMGNYMVPYLVPGINRNKTILMVEQRFPRRF